MDYASRDFSTTFQSATIVIEKGPFWTEILMPSFNLELSIDRYLTTEILAQF